MCCMYLTRGARLSASSRTPRCPPSWLMYSGNFFLHQNILLLVQGFRKES